MSGKIKIAIPVGDPAGIGPEIALKAALDPKVQAACEPMLVCDEALLARHAGACGLDAATVGLLPARNRTPLRSASAWSVRSPGAPRSRSAPPR